MTTPDVADPESSYGMPALGFANYGKGPTDPTTDWDSGGNDTAAAGGNQMIVDCAAMTHTARRCWVRFTGNATTPTVAASNGHEAMWGTASGYKPVVAEVSTGLYTITWPATIVDKLGATKTVNLKWARAHCEDAHGFFRAKVTAANVVTIECKDTSATLSDFVGDVLFVEAG